MSPRISADEEFTRFILSGSHYVASKGRVKAQALLPAWNAEASRLETSTFRVNGITVQQVWQLGYRQVEQEGTTRRIRARGVGAVDRVFAQGLSMDVNGDPYPRHVDIVEWPAERDAQLMKATEIADAMRLELDPR